MVDMINTVIYGAIALAVFFLLMATIVLPYFNDTLNVAGGIAGTAGTVTVSVVVLVLFLALIGFALHYIPKKK